MIYNRACRILSNKPWKIISFGFLSHFPENVFIDRAEYIYKSMNIGEQLLVVEPRYDSVNFEIHRQR